MKNMNLQIQKGQQNISRINTKRSISKHISKLLKAKEKWGKKEEKKIKATKKVTHKCTGEQQD